MSDLLYFEDLSVGARWKSRTHVVTADDVSRFAQLTGDRSPLHLDEEYARTSPFGRPIAHGLLGLSFVAGLSSDCPRLDTVAFLGVSGWRFLRPVYYGDQVHVISEVLQLESNGRKRGRVNWMRQLINQQGSVVQEGYFETLVARRMLVRALTKERTLVEASREEPLGAPRRLSARELQQAAALRQSE